MAPSIVTIDRWCCCASTSVGASSAAWPPLSTTASIARSATTVLPVPGPPVTTVVHWPASAWRAGTTYNRKEAQAATGGTAFAKLYMHAGMVAYDLDDGPEVLGCFQALLAQAVRHLDQGLAATADDRSGGRLTVR